MHCVGLSLYSLLVLIMAIFWCQEAQYFRPALVLQIIIFFMVNQALDISGFGIHPVNKRILIYFFDSDFPFSHFATDRLKYLVEQYGGEVIYYQLFSLMIIRQQQPYESSITLILWFCQSSLKTSAMQKLVVFMLLHKQALLIKLVNYITGPFQT